MSNPLIPRARIQLHFEVSTDAEAAELDAAWREILSGKRTRLNTAAEDLNDIMERAMAALQKLIAVVQHHPGTGQTRRVIKFLAGLYNGNDYPFDLTDLRALDTELANACIDYLNYDRLAKAEVNTHLPEGGRQMQWFIAQSGLLRRLHWSTSEQHESRLHALAERLDREPEAFLKEALSDLLARYENKEFGGLLASKQTPDQDRPLIHAHLLRETAPAPLCGASDGPWSARGFEFTRLTCRECQSIVLNPPPIAD